MSMSGVDGSYREQLVRRELSASAHKSIHSLPLNILQLILFIANVVLAFVWEYLYDKEDEKWKDGFGNPFSVQAYYNVFNWLVLLLIHTVLRRMHRTSLAEGYFSFYRRTKEIRGAPFFISSIVNTMLLALNNVLRDLTLNDPDKDDEYALHIIQGFFILELLCASFFILKYCWLVHKFNDSKDPPDYMLETNKFIDQPGENLAGRDSAVVEIGFREVGRAAEIIERQYDIIEHLSRTLRDIRGDNNGQWMNGTNNGDLMADLNGYGDRSDFSASGIDP
ncbi:transmembrane protein 192-like [Symsagittifera roscoffensis]|uniref:transmembrane protein 192-like n=1 Tax=Symsagittifera roscoffensis TaxID=84072 RepID=UPI00307B16FB